MRVLRATPSGQPGPSPELARLLATISPRRLREDVEAFAIPRHRVQEPEANRQVRERLAETMDRLGYEVEVQGFARNVVAWPAGGEREPCLLLGAHYDSVPGTPGADDNASAVAVLLAAAEALAARQVWPPLVLAFFNGEEDGLVGSREFVRGRRFDVREAHVLEMVGCCRREPGTQAVPAGLPISLPERGDFLGFLANAGSKRALERVLEAAGACVPDLPVLGVLVALGLERVLPVLSRSDHAPFWRAGVPALMWTDTAEFRNPNYHQVTDTPSTLDYEFMAQVARLLVAVAAGAGPALGPP